MLLWPSLGTNYFLQELIHMVNTVIINAELLYLKVCRVPLILHSDLAEHLQQKLKTLSLIFTNCAWFSYLDCNIHAKRRGGRGLAIELGVLLILMRIE